MVQGRNLVLLDGDCSSTVECTTVARETRVQLPSFALIQSGVEKEGKMKIELRKFNIIDYFRFLGLTLNKNYFGEFSKSFFGYITQGVKNLFNKNKFYKFAILVNRRFAGSIALYKDKKDYDLGYFVLREFRGKGVATKATKKILDFAFKKLKLDRITATTNMNNKASQKILKKLKFKKIKENKKEKEFIWEKRR